MHRAPLSLAAVLAVVLTAPAAAGAAQVAAERTTLRACSELSPADAGSRGVAAARFVPDRTGVATVGVRAARGDWDVVAFDALTGRRVAAAASSAGDEWTYAPATTGRAVTVLGCRRPGASRRAELVLRTWRTDLQADARTTATIVRVPVADDAALHRLEETGLDVTHNHDRAAGTADVVLYGPEERLRLLRAGFPISEVVTDDLRALDDAVLRADARRAMAGARSGLPSKRAQYRTLAEYDEDMKRLVAQHPKIARPVTIGTTLEGRPIDGVELARGVSRTDDGRATFLVLGVHHAREWPSGEMPIEFALDLAQRHAKGDPRVVSLLDRVRVLVVPVVNRDGFEVSRSAGPLGPLDDTVAPLPLSLTDAAAYKRKNCRAVTPELQQIPCMLRPAVQGVDLNRNYGQFWGGTGSSTNPTLQNYRGTDPYSEPESQAVRELSSTRAIPVIVTHHTYTSGGTWLRQPGLCRASACVAEQDADGHYVSGDIVEDEAPMAALGGAMARATGWASQLGWAIGQITGATEDWNYFTQGTLGYTPEQRGANFHPSHATAVVAEYDGSGPGAQGGVGEALLRAAETAADPASHAILDVTAPPGRTVKIRKAFTTPTSQPAVKVDDELEFTATIPRTRRHTLRWHLPQSSRPSCEGLPSCEVPPGTVERFELTCLTRDGTVRSRVRFSIARGQQRRVNLGCTSRSRPRP